MGIYWRAIKVLIRDNTQKMKHTISLLLFLLSLNSVSAQILPSEVYYKARPNRKLSCERAVSGFMKKHKEVVVGKNRETDVARIKDSYNKLLKTKLFDRLDYLGLMVFDSPHQFTLYQFCFSTTQYAVELEKKLAKFKDGDITSFKAPFYFVAVRIRNTVFFASLDRSMHLNQRLKNDLVSSIKEYRKSLGED